MEKSRRDLENCDSQGAVHMGGSHGWWVWYVSRGGMDGMGEQDLCVCVCMLAHVCVCMRLCVCVCVFSLYHSCKTWKIERAVQSRLIGNISGWSACIKHKENPITDTVFQYLESSLCFLCSLFWDWVTWGPEFMWVMYCVLTSTGLSTHDPIWVYLKTQVEPACTALQEPVVHRYSQLCPSELETGHDGA